MSGICGLVRLDGAPASVDQLAPVHRALAFRGPDGGGLWTEGPVALGFRLLATTPEAAVERQPWRHAPTDCTIVADARLDNRDELAAALGIDAPGRGDAELILHAYLKWGDEAPLHLLGDYAFALWDGRRHRLLAVRDPLGMRQLHYAHLPGKMLLFATDDHVLPKHRQVPAKLNLVRVADFLTDLEAADLTSTFYRDVHRLRPAHLLVCERNWVCTRRYWSLDPADSLSLHTGDLERELIRLFKQAVEARLRSTCRIGAMLSGGLDSSSVVAMAAQLRQQAGRGPLLTFSGTSAYLPDCLETSMIRQVQSLNNVVALEIPHDGAEMLEGEGDAALASLNPFDHEMTLIRQVVRLAREQGCNSLLDGAAGDVMLDYSGRPARLLRRGRMLEAWRHINGERVFFASNASTSRLFGSAIRTALAPDWLKHLKRRAALARDRRHPPAIVRPEFATRVGLAERFDLLRLAAPSPARPFSEQRARSITHPNLVVGRERYDRVASQEIIEPRDPFMDLRLVAFCLRLPMEQLNSQGWTKLILRNAMAGLLPDPVRWRRGKQHLGYLFNARLNNGPVLAIRQEAVREEKTFLELLVPAEIIAEAQATGLPASASAVKVQILARWLQVSAVET